MLLNVPPGFMAQVSFILVKKLSTGAKLKLHTAYWTCFLLLAGHMRGEVSSCKASISTRDIICWLLDKGKQKDTWEWELGHYVPMPPPSLFLIIH